MGAMGASSLSLKKSEEERKARRDNDRRTQETKTIEKGSKIHQYDPQRKKEGLDTLLHWVKWKTGTWSSSSLINSQGKSITDN